MAFGINTRNAFRVQNYEDAEELFSTTPVPRGAAWNSTQRSLDGNRKHHVRAEKGDGYFDAVLYQTSMARYFKPRAENGKEVREVWYNVHASQSSRSFQRDVLRLDWPISLDVRTTDDWRVAVGFGTKGPQAHGAFPVKLTYVDGKLDVSRSCASPEQLPAQTSPERKALRKEFRVWLRVYEVMARLDDTPLPRYAYIDPRTVREYFIRKELFDPSEVTTYIRRHGSSALVDLCFPLKDEIRYAEPFVELT